MKKNLQNVCLADQKHSQTHWMVFQPTVRQ
uniref:Uncharacterized protein n=1 Tax=Anguilla anguilla TaxID=7936 RepID=A0A0E9T9I5_ANGAN